MTNVFTYILLPTRTVIGIMNNIASFTVGCSSRPALYFGLSIGDREFSKSPGCYTHILNVVFCVKLYAANQRLYQVHL
jgi:hypothetical protein